MSIAVFLHINAQGLTSNKVAAKVDISPTETIRFSLLIVVSLGLPSMNATMTYKQFLGIFRSARGALQHAAGMALSASFGNWRASEKIYYNNMHIGIYIKIK